MLTTQAETQKDNALDVLQFFLTTREEKHRRHVLDRKALLAVVQDERIQLQRVARRK